MPLITYKIRWELWTPVYLLDERNHQMVKKTKYKRDNTSIRRANLEHPDKEIKENTSLNLIEFLT